LCFCGRGCDWGGSAFVGLVFVSSSFSAPLEYELGFVSCLEGAELDRR
jgi:hypothetical protein